MYLLVPGERTRQAELALERDPHWVAPAFWRAEFRNALALYLRRALLTLDDAVEIAEKAETLMGQRDLRVPAGRVLTLVAGSRCAAYDCEFVALAQDLGVPLVTSDQTILTEFPSTAVALEAFVA